MSHENPATTADSAPQPRGLELLFVIFIIAGMILIAIGFASLVAEMPPGAAPDACVALPQPGVFAPSWLNVRGSRAAPAIPQPINRYL